jgi:hypothetical protein
VSAVALVHQEGIDRILRVLIVEPRVGAERLTTVAGVEALEEAILCQLVTRDFFGDVSINEAGQAWFNRHRAARVAAPAPRPIQEAEPISEPQPAQIAPEEEPVQQTKRIDYEDRVLLALGNGPLSQSRLATACKTNTNVLRPVLEALVTRGDITLSGGGTPNSPVMVTLVEPVVEDDLERIYQNSEEDVVPKDEVVDGESPDWVDDSDPRAALAEVEGFTPLDERESQAAGDRDWEPAPVETATAPSVETLSMLAPEQLTPQDQYTPHLVDRPARDPEVVALEQVLAALKDLSFEGCRRVLEFAGDRLVSRGLRERSAA